MSMRKVFEFHLNFSPEDASSLRCERIVWSYLTLNSTIAEVAELFSLSERTVRRYVDLFYRTGDIVPKDSLENCLMIMSSLHFFI